MSGEMKGPSIVTNDQDKLQGCRPQQRPQEPQTLLQMKTQYWPVAGLKPPRTSLSIIPRKAICLQLLLPFQPPLIFAWSLSVIGEIFIAVAIGEEFECLFKWIGLCHHPLERGIELSCWHSGVFVKEEFTLSNAVASANECKCS
ncbi:hypothetical protein PGT21_003440 [Puccinia graminis f. sp. tritici]|uniref:Uncharacterized protein n=1 Tax=Puccinia graminis f. sp. tritici TaxID=56615 RepID=A0A5B0MQI8_PUCGR|nr:hypothetical protein PGT21_003440 [Puccinia graminis f. sp. tritici]